MGSTTGSPIHASSKSINQDVLGAEIVMDKHRVGHQPGIDEVPVLALNALGGHCRQGNPLYVTPQLFVERAPPPVTERCAKQVSNIRQSVRS